MGTYMPIGISAALSSSSLRLPNVSTYGRTTYKVQHVSPRRFRQAVPNLEPILRRSGLKSGGGERDVKQCETSCRSLQVNRRGGLLGVKRWSRGRWSIPVRSGDGQEAWTGKVLVASEESEAEKISKLPGANSSPGEKRIFIFGFGYTSCALASYLEDNWKVSGTCRSEEKRAALERSGFSVHVFNSDNDGEELRNEGLRELQEATHWLISIPPVADFDSDPVLTRHAQDLTRAVGNGNVGWIGYLSSTGVYGDWQGDWVDELSKPRPVERKALARLAAEEAWLKFGLDHGVPVHVFRMGGIYGPGRSAIDTILRTKALTGRQQNREQRRFTSRIHVADVSQTVLASMQNPDSGRTYNVVDNDPASRIEVWSYARDLLSKHEDYSQRQSVEKVVSSAKRAQGRSNSVNQRGEKRVSNKRIKIDLKVKLLYPTYREGLKAILKLKDESARKHDNE